MSHSPPANPQNEQALEAGSQNATASSVDRGSLAADTSDSRQGARTNFSFEVFPPKNDAAKRSLLECLGNLRDLQPNFVSVTYGAGGSSQERTTKTVSCVAQELSLPVAAHITCVGQTRRAVDQTIEHYIEGGVRRIVALRGDSPQGEPFQPAVNGYQSSVELIEALVRRRDLEVAVGCYPEVHPEARSATADLEQLKRKQDAGASCAISQFFFDADVFLRFLERARAAGVTIPIVPGILPVRSFTAVQNMANRCGTKIPDAMAKVLAPLDVPEKQTLATAAANQMCVNLCRRLQDDGLRDFHFYTINRADMTRVVCEELALLNDKPEQAGRSKRVPCSVQETS